MSRIIPNVYDTYLEPLSARLHAIYQREARRQGDIRHPDDYEALPEHTKDFDRVLAHFILRYATEEEVIDMLTDPLEE